MTQKQHACTLIVRFGPFVQTMCERDSLDANMSDSDLDGPCPGHRNVDSMSDSLGLGPKPAFCSTHTKVKLLSARGCFFDGKASSSIETVGHTGMAATDGRRKLWDAF